MLSEILDPQSGIDCQPKNPLNSSLITPSPIPLRLPTDRLADCCWLPRFADKTHRLLAGKLPLAYRVAFGSPTGVDGYFLNHFGIVRGDFIRAVRSAADDDALAVWFLAQPTVTLPAIEAWNELAPKLGAKGQPARFVFLVVRPVLYAKPKARRAENIFEAIIEDERDAEIPGT